MSDVLLNAASYLWLALILYYFIQELMAPKSGASKWLAYAIGFFLLLFVVWIVWTLYREKSVPESEDHAEVEMDEDDSFFESDEFDPDSFEPETPEKGNVHIPNTYKVQKRKFNLVNQVVPRSSEMSYEFFKRWYLSPEFLSQYTEAMNMALKIKLRKLLNVRKQYSDDLQTIKAKNPPKDKLSGILSNLDNRGDDRKLLETTISEIDDIIKQIRIKKKNISLEATRKALVSAINDPNSGVESITGRQDIKNFLALQLYTFAQNPRIFFQNFQNIAIYGGAGLGKTKIAKVIGHVYATSGILIRNHVHIITKQSLTTAYVNESAKMTRRVLLSNLESVFF